MSLIEIIHHHGPAAVTVSFCVAFAGIAIWAYRPSNKQKLQSYADIPLKEDRHGA